jgi:hypothetical protein
MIESYEKNRDPQLILMRHNSNKKQKTADNHNEAPSMSGSLIIPVTVITGFLRSGKNRP